MNRLRPTIFYAVLSILWLAACGGAPEDTLAPSFDITSGPTTTGAGYTVTGTVTDDVGVTGVRYRLNGGAATPVAVTAGTSVALDVGIGGLAEGLNHLELSAEDAAGNEETADLYIGRLDSEQPLVALASAATSSSAAYELEGYAFDNEGVTSLGYSLNGAAAVDLAPDADGRFRADLTLTPGDNALVVTAEDAEGNTGSAELTVDYQAPPTELGLSTTVAARGDVITVTGRDLGADGTLTVGGVEAEIRDWSESEVEAVLAADTPGGPQEVVLTSAFGSERYPDLFVGVEFTGDAAELQEFLDGLEKGAAVLLQAETYELSTAPDPLIVDNHGLYGRGEGATVLRAPDGIAVLADYGQEVAFAEMGIETDEFILATGSFGDTSVFGDSGAFSSLELGTRTLELAAPAALRTERDDSFGGRRGGRAQRPLRTDPIRVDLPSVRWDDAALQAQALRPQGATPPRIELRDLDVKEIAGGGGFGSPHILYGASDGPLPAGDISLENVSYDGPGSAFVLLPSQAVSIDGSSIDAAVIAAGSLNATLAVSDSSLLAVEQLIAVAETGLAVDGSTMRASNGSLMVVGAFAVAGGGGSFPSGGPVEITGSTIEALDGDPTDTSDVGTIRIATALAPLVLTDNPAIRSHGETVIGTEGGAWGEADVTLRGNTIRTGIFADDVDDPAQARAADLVITTINDPGVQAGTLTLEDNTVVSSGSAQVAAESGAPGHLVARGNTVTAGDGRDDGAINMVSGESSVLVFEDNVLSSDDRVLVSAVDLDGATARFAGNAVSAIGDDGPALTLSFTGGSCEIAANTLVSEDVGADSSGYVYLACDSSDPAVDTFVVRDNEIAVADSGIGYPTFDFGAGTLALSGNTISSGNGLDLIDGGVTGSVDANVLDLGTYGIYVEGTADTDLTVTSNTVTLGNVDGSGLDLTSVGTATVTDNAFTVGGTPTMASVALSVEADSNATTVVATGNTFTNFDRALYFRDGADYGITARINHNVFDFPIDTHPEAAELVDVGDVIDAKHNTWGENTHAGIVNNCVVRVGDTDAKGGGIVVTPITLP